MSELSVHRTVSVQAPIDHAFSAFTSGIAGWWPQEYYIGADPAETIVIEPRRDGRWFERAANGAETDWGRVLVWDPPHRLVLTWQIGPFLTEEWAYDPDPAKATEVEVRFTPEGPGTTRLELWHTGFENQGVAGKSTGEAFGRPGGWSGILDRFIGRAATPR